MVGVKARVVLERRRLGERREPRLEVGDGPHGAGAGAGGDRMQPVPEGLRRRAAPEECAAVIVFLASDMAGFVTGSTIPVDGGTVAAAAWKIAGDGRFVM